MTAARKFTSPFDAMAAWMPASLPPGVPAPMAALMQGDLSAVETQRQTLVTAGAEAAQATIDAMTRYGTAQAEIMETAQRMSGPEDMAQGWASQAEATRAMVESCAQAQSTFLTTLMDTMAPAPRTTSAGTGKSAKNPTPKSKS